MYGMVNKAIEGLITEQFGDETWEEIVEKAGVEDESFASLESYPDEVTYKLVGAASEVLQAPAEDLLRAFGTYWTKYVGTAGYGELMDLENKPVGEFLAGLNDMHTRVALSFPDLAPPSFSVEGTEAEGFLVHYKSERPGLGPMVIGLLEGVLELKNLTGSATWVEKKEEGNDHDVFRLKVA